MTYDAFNEWERGAWQTRADAYAAGIQQMTRGSIDALLDGVGATRGRRLADVGCGPGPVSVAATARGCEVIGVDVSTAMLELARTAAPAAEFREGSAEALPIGDAELDAVCGNYVLPHVGHPVTAVREALRVVRAGGRVGFTDWDRARAEPLAVFWRLVQSSGMPMPPGAPPGPTDQHGDPEVMTRTLRAAGGADVETRELHWTFRVDPAAWWDSTIAATPRTGAVIAAASKAERWALRNRYDADMARFATGDGTTVELPVVATLGIATKS
jgi:SAM-dependent methyltransferase